MNKTQYNEPMFKVVISSAQDVLTASWDYEYDNFESEMISVNNTTMD